METSTNIDIATVQKAFEDARLWIGQNLPMFTPYLDEPQLEIVETDDGWDVHRSVKERKIKVNLKRIRWHLEREKAIRNCPKYDIETALIHDLFEYCFIRHWNYPEDNPGINWNAHYRARVIENMIRRRKGLTDWM